MKTLEEYLELCKGVDQNNPYHDLDLYEHTMKAVNYAKEHKFDPHVIMALHWHDIGKLYCKQETPERTRYVGHERESYNLFCNAEFRAMVFGVVSAWFVADLILYHDRPITKKLLNKFTTTFVECLLQMKEADRYAHSDYAKTNPRAIENLRKENELLKTWLREVKIQRRLESDYKLLEDMGYTVVGVFLQGSQNYGLDTPDSDIDTKAIVLPSFEDVALGKKQVSTTHVLPNNEHIDIKDIRNMFDNFLKSNINFLEILFTKYKKLNSEFAKELSPIFINKEKIAKYDIKRFLNGICGMVHEKHKKLRHPRPGVAEQVEKHGYDSKQLHHMLRLYEFALRFGMGTSFKHCLYSNRVNELNDIKAYRMNPDAVDFNAEAWNEGVKSFKDEYLANNEVGVDSSVVGLLDDVKLAVLKKHFRKELNECDQR